MILIEWIIKVIVLLDTPTLTVWEELELLNQDESIEKELLDKRHFSNFPQHKPSTIFMTSKRLDMFLRTF